MKVIGISGKARHGKDTCATILRDVAEREYGLRAGIWSLAHPLKARVLGEAHGTLSFEDVWINKPPVLRTLLQQTGTERGRLVFGEEFWLLQAEAFIRLFEESMGLDLVIVPDIRFPNEVEFAQFGGRAPMAFRAAQYALAREAVGLTAEREEDLMVNDFPTLFEAERAVETNVTLLMQAHRAAHPGVCLRIRSNRPTLTGDAAQHPSETALDGLSDAAFDGVIRNMRRTTLDGLRRQLRPHVQSLFPQAIRRRARRKATAA